MSDFDPLDIEGQEAAAALRKEQAERDRATDVDIFQWLMGNKRGRRFVRGLIAEAGVYKNDHGDALKLARDAGKRDVGLKLIAMINEHCPDRYVLMLQGQ